MNKTKIAALAAVLIALGGSFYLKGSQDATLNRPIFDDFDKKKLKKAYRVMFKKIMNQEYDFDIDDKTEADLDALLIEEYHKL